MARKKKKVEEIKLSNEALIPASIGSLKEGNTTTIILIVLFSVLIFFTITLPYVTDYFASFKKNNNSGTPTKPTENNDDEDLPPVEDIVYYDLSTNIMIKEKGIEITDFSLSSTTNLLSYNVKNVSEKTTFFRDNDYYIELYSNDDMLLQRIKVPAENLTKDTTTTLTGELDPEIINLAKRLVFIQKTEEDIPVVDLIKDIDDTYKLTCSKGKYDFTYTFDLDQKLESIKEVYSIDANNTEYKQLLIESSNKYSKYSNIPGVGSELVENSLGFNWRTIIDLKKADLNSNSVKQILNGEEYFPLDTKAKIIYFELSSLMYKCK